MAGLGGRSGMSGATWVPVAIPPIPEEIYGGKGSRKPLILFDSTQDLNSTDAIQVFNTTATKGLAAMPNPTVMRMSNIGDAALGLSVKIPIWTDDSTQSGSNYLQMILPAGTSFEFPTTQIIDSADENLNTGTEVSTFTTPSSDLYVAAASTYSDGSITAAATTIYVDNNAGSPATTAHMFRVGDLIRIDNEILRVNAITVGTDEGTLTVERALYGSGAASHADNAVIRYAYFNTTHDYDKFSTLHTNSSGVYTSTNFFGLGRAVTVAGSGIVPGSAVFKFYSRPKHAMGISNVGPMTNSGLTSGSTYYFQVICNDESGVEISFTVDSVAFGGANGVMHKINEQLRAAFYDPSSGLYEKQVSVSLSRGDLLFVFDERKSGSTITITSGTSGSSSTNLFSGSTNIGRFPIAANTNAPILTVLPLDTVFSNASYEERPNLAQFIYDNGTGRLSGGAGSGYVDHETGSVSINGPANAEFQYVVCHSSGLAGRASVTKANLIEAVYARSTNTKVNSKIQIQVRG